MAALRPVLIRPIAEKKGSKRHLLVEGHGVPIGFVVTGANVHDVKMLEPVLDSIVIEPPNGLPNLCADNGYRGARSELIMMDHDYYPHIRGRGEEKVAKIEGYKARRWVVEACHSWQNRFRKLLVRFEKQTENYIALLQCACALICWRKVI